MMNNFLVLKWSEHQASWLTGSVLSAMPIWVAALNIKPLQLPDLDSGDRWRKSQCSSSTEWKHCHSVVIEIVDYWVQNVPKGFWSKLLILVILHSIGSYPAKSKYECKTRRLLLPPYVFVSVILPIWVSVSTMWNQFHKASLNDR